MLQVMLSRLTPSSVGFLRLLRDFLGVAFSFEQQLQQHDLQQQQQQQQEQEEGESSEEDEETGRQQQSEPLDLSWAPQVVATCVGIGYKSLSLSSF